MGTTSSPDTMAAAAGPSLSITVEKNPPEARLLQLGIKSWPKVRASVKGTGRCVEFGAGDLVVFPKGLSCTWDVVVGIDKHYNFDS
jgi:hypothetical protein